MDNQGRFLKKLMHARPGKEALFTDALSLIDVSREKLTINGEPIEDSRNHIMGLEGTAGRAYFQCLTKLMPEKHRFP